MAEEKKVEVNPAAVANTISDETGQYDARFMLWRMFCVEHDVPVETLPSDLTGEVKEKWEKIKNDELHKPAEEGTKEQ